MSGFRFRFSARRLATEESKLSDETYHELEPQGIAVENTVLSGNGTADAPYEYHVIFNNVSGKDFEGVLQIELLRTKENPRFFLPGFMYGRNRGNTPMSVPNEFPRIRSKVTMRPASPKWLVRSDRVSHPAAFVFDQGTVFGFAAYPFWAKEDQTCQRLIQCLKPDGDFQYGGFGCDIDAGENECSLSYTIGYENAPWLFVQSHTVLDRAPLGDNCICLKAGERLTVTLYVYDYAAEFETGIHMAIQDIYHRIHEKPRKVGNPDTAIKDLTTAVFECGWLPDEHNYSCFVREGENGGFNYHKILSLAWTGGYSVAIPQLLAANYLKHDAMRAQALDCIEYIRTQSKNERSGLSYDACNDGEWSLNGWWFDGMHSGGHSAYLNGQFVYYLCKAYESEKITRGIEHPEWLEQAEGMLEIFQRERNREGEYPFSFSEETGVGLEYDSFGGTWCLAAAAYFSRLTGCRKYLEELLLSEQHYYDKFVRHAECYGAPLDTDKAVDSEGILAYVRAVRELHKITGDSKLLQHMKDGLDYEFTFKFCYNVPVQVDPLKKIGWSSCGGSITSVCNPHIHPMSSSIAGEMKYYVEQTGDEYVKSRLEDTVAWGCQTYNTYDGEYDYGRKGWMSERFCYSQGLLVEKYPDGTPASTWFALMPWASASITEGLADYQLADYQSK